MGEIDKTDKIVNNALKGHNNSSVGQRPTWHGLQIRASNKQKHK
jgi:hypothetical protein